MISIDMISIGMCVLCVCMRVCVEEEGAREEKEPGMHSKRVPTLRRVVGTIPSRDPSTLQPFNSSNPSTREPFNSSKNEQQYPTETLQPFNPSAEVDPSTLSLLLKGSRVEGLLLLKG